MSQSFLCRQDNDKYRPALIASISHEILRFSAFFHVEYCLKMFYQFLKLTLNVKILRLENILCEKTITIFRTLNREPFIPMPFLF